MSLPAIPTGFSSRPRQRRCQLLQVAELTAYRIRGLVEKNKAEPIGPISTGS